MSRWNQFPIVDSSGINATNDTKMPWEYLRDQAHRCMRLARNCPDQKTSHALEAMGMEFLDKARDLEKTNSIVSTETNEAD